jgi:hypothetical protein
MLVGMTKPRLPDVLFDHITGRGPLPVDELGAHAKEHGLTTARDPAKTVQSRLRQDDRFCELPDGRWTTLRRLLEGRWFTHRVRDDEVIAQAFADELDLGVPYQAVGQRADVWGGGYARVIRGYLSGEGSWLDGLSAGDLVGVTFREGRLSVTKVPEPPAPSVAGALVATAIRDALVDLRRHYYYGERRFHDETSAVVAAIAKDSTLLTVPVRPLSELIPEAAGRGAGESFLTEGHRCEIRLEEGCGCYRCHCKAIGHVRLELDGEQVRTADRRFRAAGRSLTQRIADVVDAVLLESASEQLPSRGALAAVPDDDWDEAMWT